jgi:hypothetical protein
LNFYASHLQKLIIQKYLFRNIIFILIKIMKIRITLLIILTLSCYVACGKDDTRYLTSLRVDDQECKSNGAHYVDFNSIVVSVGLVVHNAPDCGPVFEKFRVGKTYQFPSESLGLSDNQYEEPNFIVKVDDKAHVVSYNFENKGTTVTSNKTFVSRILDLLTAYNAVNELLLKLNPDDTQIVDSQQATLPAVDLHTAEMEVHYEGHDGSLCVGEGATVDFNRLPVSGISIENGPDCKALYKFVDPDSEGTYTFPKDMVNSIPPVLSNEREVSIRLQGKGFTIIVVVLVFNTPAESQMFHRLYREFYIWRPYHSFIAAKPKHPIPVVMEEMATKGLRGNEKPKHTHQQANEDSSVEENEEVGLPPNEFEDISNESTVEKGQDEKLFKFASSDYDNFRAVVDITVSSKDFDHQGIIVGAECSFDVKKKIVHFSYESSNTNHASILWHVNSYESDTVKRISVLNREIKKARSMTQNEEEQNPENLKPGAILIVDDRLTFSFAIRFTEEAVRNQFIELVNNRFEVKPLFQDLEDNFIGNNKVSESEYSNYQVPQSLTAKAVNKAGRIFGFDQPTVDNTLFKVNEFKGTLKSLFTPKKRRHLKLNKY